MIASWRTAFASDGYLCLQNVLSRDTVLRARNRILTHLIEEGFVRKDIDAELKQVEDLRRCLPALAVDPDASPQLLRCTELQRDKTVVAALEHSRLVGLIGKLLDPAPENANATDSTERCVWTSEYKWIRAVPRAQCTGLHLDRVYMRSQDDSPLISMWMPLGDVTADHGAMVVARGSHRSAQFAKLRAEYGESMAGANGNGTSSGWIDVKHWTDAPHRIDWVYSGSLRAGSIILLDLKVLHGTSRNIARNSDELYEYRLSCDTRWSVTSAAQPGPAATIAFARCKG